MAAIVGVHGIFLWSRPPDSSSIQEEWWPCLAQSVRLASQGRVELKSEDVSVAYYALVFPNSPRGEGAAAAAQERWEEEFSTALAAEVLRLARKGLAATHRPVRVGVTTLAALLARGPLVPRFLRRLAGRALASMLQLTVKDASVYFHDPEARRLARELFLRSLTNDTRVVIAHSLGSVVAYEALALSGRELDLFITIGSPLGIRDLYFDRLQPGPAAEGGAWPAGVRRWVNISQTSDWVSVVRSLGSLFACGPRGQVLEEHLVPGPAVVTESHMARHYLAEPALAQAVAAALDHAGTTGA